MSAKGLTIDDVFKEYIPLAQKAIEQCLPRTFDQKGLEHLFGEVRNPLFLLSSVAIAPWEALGQHRRYVLNLPPSPCPLATASPMTLFFSNISHFHVGSLCV